MSTATTRPTTPEGPQENVSIVAAEPPPDGPVAADLPPVMPEDNSIVVAESPPVEAVLSSEVAPPPAEQWMGEQTRTVCMVVIAMVAGGAAAVYLRNVLAPLLIALFLFYLLMPLTDALYRLKVPRWLSAPVLATVLFFVLFGLGQATYGYSVAVKQKWPEYSEKFSDRFDDLLRGLGYRPEPDKEGVKVFSQKNLLEAIAQFQEDNRRWMVETGMSIGETSLMAVFYLLFLFIEAKTLPRKLVGAFRRDTADDAQSMGTEVNDKVKRYLLYKTLVNLGIGVSTAFICWVMGLDFWLLWGILMFLLNYITYIGSIAALVPPVMLALIQFKNPWVGGGLALALIANRLLWVDYVEIRFLGNVLNLSPVVMLLSIAFFGTVWGVVGLLLAVPLMTSVRIVLSYYESTRHYAVLMSEE